MYDYVTLAPVGSPHGPLGLGTRYTIHSKEAYREWLSQYEARAGRLHSGPYPLPPRERELRSQVRLVQDGPIGPGWVVRVESLAETRQEAQVILYRVKQLSLENGYA